MGGIECGVGGRALFICFFCSICKKKWSTGIFLLVLYDSIIIIIIVYQFLFFYLEGAQQFKGGLSWGITHMC